MADSVTYDCAIFLDFMDGSIGFGLFSVLHAAGHTAHKIELMLNSALHDAHRGIASVKNVSHLNLKTEYIPHRSGFFKHSAAIVRVILVSALIRYVARQISEVTRDSGDHVRNEDEVDLRNPWVIFFGMPIISRRVSFGVGGKGAAINSVQCAF